MLLVFQILNHLLVLDGLISVHGAICHIALRYLVLLWIQAVRVTVCDAALVQVELFGTSHAVGILVAVTAPFGAPLVAITAFAFAVRVLTRRSQTDSLSLTWVNVWRHCFVELVVVQVLVVLMAVGILSITLSRLRIDLEQRVLLLLHLQVDM